MDERACLAALAALPGVLPSRLRPLVETCGGACAAWSLPGRELARRMGLGGAAAERLAEEKRRLEPGRLLEDARRLGAAVWTWDDADYPAALRDLDEPPPVLYRLGGWDASAPAAAVVGTRRPDRVGVRVAERLARDLARGGVVVVSGLARGIDAAAHRGALQGGGQTVAVLGSGLDLVYPPEHRDLLAEAAATGAVLTEHPPGAAPRPAHFPWRNRIIAALAGVTVVVQADRRSGALITAAYAAELGREVMAVPGDVDRSRSAGTNLLLAEGAHVVTGVEDVLAVLRWPGLGRRARRRGGRPGAGTPAAAGEGDAGGSGSAPGLAFSPPLSDIEERMLRCLSDEAQAIERLARRAGLPVGAALSALVALEVRGLAGQLPGPAYIRLQRPDAD